MPVAVRIRHSSAAIAIRNRLRALLRTAEGATTEQIRAMADAVVLADDRVRQLRR